MMKDKDKNNEAILELRKKVLQAENERVKGEPALSVSEARSKLRERLE